MNIDQLVLKAMIVSDEPSLGLRDRLSIPKEKAMKIRKLKLAVAIASMCLGATVLGTGSYLWLKPAEAEFSRIAQGKELKVHLSGFGGRVLIYAPDGDLLGETGSKAAAGHRTSVTVGSTTTDIEGLGRFEIKDKSGRLLAVIEMLREEETEERKTDSPLKAKTVTEQMKIEREQFWAQSSSDGLSVGLNQVMYKNTAKGFGFYVTGAATVKFTSASKNMITEGTSVFNPKMYEVLGLKDDYQKPTVPTLEWYVDSKKVETKGYGTFEVKDPKGKSLGVIEISR